MMVQLKGPLDRYTQANHRLLLGSAAAFALWQLADMVGGSGGGASHPVIRMLSLLPWAAWSVLLVVTLKRGGAAGKDALLRATLQDERVRDVRLRAYRVAFGTTVGSAAILAVPGVAHLLTAATATRLVVVVGVTTLLVAFVVLDAE